MNTTYFVIYDEYVFPKRGSDEGDYWRTQQVMPFSHKEGADNFADVLKKNRHRRNIFVTHVMYNFNSF